MATFDKVVTKIATFEPQQGASFPHHDPNLIIIII